jgi:hypothetical protein
MNYVCCPLNAKISLWLEAHEAGQPEPACRRTTNGGEDEDQASQLRGSNLALTGTFRSLAFSVMT